LEFFLTSATPFATVKLGSADGGGGGVGMRGGLPPPPHLRHQVLWVFNVDTFSEEEKSARERRIYFLLYT